MDVTVGTDTNDGSEVARLRRWRCPLCFSELRDQHGVVLCPQCNLAYQVSNDVINFLRGEDALQGVHLSEQETWDKNATFYSEMSFSPFQVRLHEQKLRVFSRNIGASVRTVLDVGCGQGSFLKAFAEALPRVKVLGIDYSRGMIERAKEIFPAQDLAIGSAARIPLPTASVDALILNGALHHFKTAEDWAGIQSELDRVLAPGGLLLIYDRHSSFLGRSIHHLAVWLRSMMLKFKSVPTCASDLEPDFSLEDLGYFLKSRKYVLLDREFTANIVTFLAVCASNLAYYLGSTSFARKAQSVLSSCTKSADRFLNLDALSVEQILVLQKPS